MCLGILGHCAEMEKRIRKRSDASHNSTPLGNAERYSDIIYDSPGVGNDTKRKNLDVVEEEEEL
jgi:hypothetical protein